MWQITDIHLPQYRIEENRKIHLKKYYKRFSNNGLRLPIRMPSSMNCGNTIDPQFDQNIWKHWCVKRLCTSSAFWLLESLRYHKALNPHDETLATKLLMIDDYLTGRTQSVRIEGVESKKRVITPVVPQGSVLGPPLFLLYINDPPDVASSTLALLFADIWKY